MVISRQNNYYRNGLGDLGLGDAGVPVLAPVTETAASAAGSIVATGLTSSSGFAMSSLAIPVIGAAIAGVTLGITLWMNRLGPKQKVATTKIVNEAEPLLQQNLDAWEKSDKTIAEQQQALANYDNIWGQVVSICSQSQYGDPGHSCIDDRLPAGVVIQAGGNTYTGNGRFPWSQYYRDPIANDPDVGKIQPQATAEQLGQPAGAASLIPSLASDGSQYIVLLGIVLLLGGIYFSAQN